MNCSSWSCKVWSTGWLAAVMAGAFVLGILAEFGFRLLAVMVHWACHID